MKGGVLWKGGFMKEGWCEGECCGRTPPPSGHQAGRYAFYWNAFLFFFVRLWQNICKEATLFIFIFTVRNEVVTNGLTVYLAPEQEMLQECIAVHGGGTVCLQ